MNKVTKTIVKKLRKDKCTEILYDLLVFMFDESHKAGSSDDSSSESSSDSDSESEDDSGGVEETKETDLDTNTCAPPNSEECGSDSESDGKIWCNRDVFKDGSKEV
jgi:hypothetical protein